MENKKSKIAAVFQGEHGSLGYKKGRMYHLELTTKPVVKNNSLGIVFCIKRCDSQLSVCEYSSIHTFLDNWSVMYKFK